VAIPATLFVCAAFLHASTPPRASTPPPDRSPYSTWPGVSPKHGRG